MAAATGNFLYDEVLPRVERLHWLAVGIGLVFRYLLLRGSSTLLMVGLGGLATVYFLWAFAPETEETGPDLLVNYSPVSESPNSLRIFQYIASALTLIGILFKLLFWKDQAALLSIGISVLLVTISLRWAAGRLAHSSIVIGSFGLLTWLVPTETLVRQFYRDDPALMEKMLFQHRHPDDKAAAAEVQRLLQARHNR
jgi:hypothetical protein